MMDPLLILHKMAAMLLPSVFLTPADRERFDSAPGFFQTVLMEEGGYFHIQMTKPDTVGMSQLEVKSTSFKISWFGLWQPTI